MATMVVSKINGGDVEGEDFDTVAFESSISSILNFLEPAPRELPHTLDEQKYCNKSEAMHPDLPHVDISRQILKNTCVVAPDVVVEPMRSSSPPQSDMQLGYSANKSASAASDESNNVGTKTAGAPAEGKNVEADINNHHRLQQEMDIQQPCAEENILETRRCPTSPSCSSDGAGSTASAVAPALGYRVADACKSAVRDMLREVLLETLPLQEAAEVLFKVDSHTGWRDIRSTATAIIAASLAGADIATTAGGGDGNGGGGGGAAPEPPHPRPYCGSTSVPCTPAKPSKMTSHAAGASLNPPLPPPLYDIMPVGAAAASSTLAPLTPARSAPPGSVPPVSGHDSIGILGDTAAAAAGSSSSSPIGSGSGGCTEIAGGPSLLVNIMQSHPHLMEYLQNNPQVLSSVMNGMQEGFVPAPTPFTSGPAGLPLYDDAGSGNLAAVLRGLSPPPPQPMSSPATSSIRSPPAMASPLTHGSTGGALSIWGSPLPPVHGSPVHAGAAAPFGSPQPRGPGAAVSGLETFHLLMGGGNSAAAAAVTHADAGGSSTGVAAGGGGPLLQGIDPSSEGYSCKAFEELNPAVREKIQSVLDTCGPHIRAEHFDAGVRHWLLQLQVLFGELCAVSALHAIKTAANLEGVRRMKAFITTRLIDHYEQMVWAQDPQGYAIRKLTPDLIVVLQDLVHSDKGLKWTHFDPKVLDTIREIRSPDAVRTRLFKLCAQELNGVQNVPAYLYTLLSKRGKTAKQAAAQKQMQELALRLAAAQGGMGGGVGMLGLGGVGVGGPATGGLGGFGGISGLGEFGSAASGAYGAMPYGGGYGSGFAGGSGGYGASGAGGFGAGGLGSYGASSSAYGTGAGGSAFVAGLGGGPGGYGAGGSAGGLGGLGGFGGMFGK